MDESFASSVLSRTGWEPLKGTVKVFDAKNGLWVARVRTTHLKKSGLEEEEFFVLVIGSQHIILEDSSLAALGEWCQEQTLNQDIALCCFNCRYVARSVIPGEASRQIQQHYTDKHAAEIKQLIQMWNREGKE